MCILLSNFPFLAPHEKFPVLAEMSIPLSQESVSKALIKFSVVTTNQSTLYDVHYGALIGIYVEGGKRNKLAVLICIVG